MSDEFLGRYDLLGDPIPENHGGRGRPAHVTTVENRNKVRLLLAFGWTDPRIAQALRITRPTLRKHYFAELRQREEATHQLVAQQLLMLYEAAAGGNVGAIKELGREIEKHGLALLSQTVQSRGAAKADEPAKPPKLGKKEERDAAALNVGGKYGVRPPPSGRVH